MHDVIDDFSTRLATDARHPLCTDISTGAADDSTILNVLKQPSSLRSNSDSKRKYNGLSRLCYWRWYQCHRLCHRCSHRNYRVSYRRRTFLFLHVRNCHFLKDFTGHCRDLPHNRGHHMLPLLHRAQAHKLLGRTQALGTSHRGRSILEFTRNLRKLYSPLSISKSSYSHANAAIPTVCFLTSSNHAF